MQKTREAISSKVAYNLDLNGLFPGLSPNCHSTFCFTSARVKINTQPIRPVGLLIDWNLFVASAESPAQWGKPSWFFTVLSLVALYLVSLLCHTFFLGLKYNRGRQIPNRLSHNRQATTGLCGRDISPWLNTHTHIQTYKERKGKEPSKYIFKYKSHLFSSYGVKVTTQTEPLCKNKDITEQTLAQAQQ